MIAGIALGVVDERYRPPPEWHLDTKEYHVGPLMGGLDIRCWCWLCIARRLRPIMWTFEERWETGGGRSLAARSVKVEV